MASYEKFIYDFPLINLLTNKTSEESGERVRREDKFFKNAEMFVGPDVEASFNFPYLRLAESASVHITR